MALTFARVQGRYAVTPHSGARVGSRGRRLVTAVPGRLRASCSPALRPVRGVLPLDWDRRHRVTPGKPRPRKPGLKLSLGDRRPSGKSRGGTPRGERAALCARRTRTRTRKVRRLDTRLSAFRFLAFFFLTFVARSADREIPAATAGFLWRRSVRRAKKISS